MDLTSLVVLAAIMLGLVVSDAAVSGGNLALTISVPQKIADTGFTTQTAEDVFTAEAARIGRTSSIVPPPVVETTAHPGLLGALVKPLNLVPRAGSGDSVSAGESELPRSGEIDPQASRTFGRGSRGHLVVSCRITC